MLGSARALSKHTLRNSVPALSNSHAAYEEIKFLDAGGPGLIMSELAFLGLLWCISLSSLRAYCGPDGAN
jgi:hypothetical protein